MWRRQQNQQQFLEIKEEIKRAYEKEPINLVHLKELEFNLEHKKHIISDLERVVKSKKDVYERYKQNIEVIGCALNKTSQIKGVTFNWAQCGAKAIGVIAQDVEPVFPELVVTQEDGYKVVKYDNMVAILIESVKELKARIEKLESQVNK